MQYPNQLPSILIAFDTTGSLAGAPSRCRFFTPELFDFAFFSLASSSRQLFSPPPLPFNLHFPLFNAFHLTI